MEKYTALEHYYMTQQEASLADATGGVDEHSQDGGERNNSTILMGEDVVLRAEKVAKEAVTEAKKNAILRAEKVAKKEAVAEAKENRREQGLRHALLRVVVRGACCIFRSAAYRTGGHARPTQSCPTQCSTSLHIVPLRCSARRAGKLPLRLSLHFNFLILHLPCVLALRLRRVNQVTLKRPSYRNLTRLKLHVLIKALARLSEFALLRYHRIRVWPRCSVWRCCAAVPPSATQVPRSVCDAHLGD